jgi:multiple sugar transport system substrate-binding protein
MNCPPGLGRRGLAAVAAGLTLASPRLTSAQGARRVEVWHVFNIDTDMIHPAIRAFNTRNADVQIEPRIVPLPQIAPEITRAVATGAVPDLITASNEQVVALAAQGVLEDITDPVRASQAIQWEKIYPGPRASGTFRSRIYGVPRAVNTLALYWNRDAFAEAGLPDRAPTTWAETMQFAERLTNPQRNRFGFGFSAIQTEEGTFQFLPWLQQAGASVATLDSPGAVEALTYWKTMVDRGFATRDVVTMRQYEVANTFMSGNAAMIVTGPWDLPRIAQGSRHRWAVALLPVHQDRNIRASALGDFLFCVPKGARNRAGALRVLDHMLSDETLANAWQGGRLPPRPGLVRNAEFPEALATFEQQMEFARMRGPHTRWPEISRPIQTAIQEAITGRATPQQALSRAAQQVNAILAREPLLES